MKNTGMLLLIIIFAFLPTVTAQEEGSNVTAIGHIETIILKSQGKFLAFRLLMDLPGYDKSDFCEVTGIPESQIEAIKNQIVNEFIEIDTAELSSEAYIKYFNDMDQIIQNSLTPEQLARAREYDYMMPSFFSVALGDISESWTAIAMDEDEDEDEEEIDEEEIETDNRDLNFAFYETLDLSEEQRKEFAQIQEEFNSEIRQISGKTKEEIGEDDIFLNKLMDRIQELEVATKAKINDRLTPEQKERIDNLVKQYVDKIFQNKGEMLVYPSTPLQNDPQEEEQSLFAGNQNAPLPSNNRVGIDYVPGKNIADPDSAYGGVAWNGTVEKNKLTFKNGHVPRFVLGGFSLKGDAIKNSVVFENGLAADAAIGKLCGGQTLNGDVIENAAIITGGEVVGDVYGGDAHADGNAKENCVEITDGKFSGFVNAGGVSGIGIAKKNKVTISGGSVAMGVAGGFAHFAAGTPPKQSEHEKNKVKTNSVLENSVTISGNAEINGNVSGGFILDSDGSANKNSVEITGGVIRGTVYGGRAYSGEANGNTIVISDGTVKNKDNAIYAGYVHKPKDGGAAGNTITISGKPDLETITLHGNNLASWKTDENTLNFKGFRGNIHGISHFQNVNIDKDSIVTILGDGPLNVVNLNNQGQVVFKNGKFVVPKLSTETTP